MISIITPVFNGRDFIEKCINNVAAQHGVDYEHIIVDGGSTDGTAELLKQIAPNFSNVKWISEKDNGQSDAMNKGIGIARGEHIGILNVDDYYEPNIFQRIHISFQNIPSPALLVGNCNVFTQAGILKEINQPTRLDIAHLLANIDIYPFPYNPAAYFYHKSLHNLIGLYDVNDHYSMDLDFILRAVQSSHYKYFNELWGNYQQIEGTKSVIDMQDGLALQRRKLIISRYFQVQPLSVKCRVLPIFYS